LRFQPDDIHARVNRGKCYVSTRQYDRALIDFDRVLEIDNVSFEAFLGRSQVFLAQKQLDAALAECNKAARLDNHNAGVFSNLAGIYFEFCDYSAAIEEYSRAIELSTDPELRAQNLYQRGLAYYELGHFDQTLNDMHQANLLRPYHSGSWIWKAAASARLEKWSLAIHSLQQAIAARPAAARQYHDLGAPVAKRAIAFFTRELQRGHNSAEVYRSRGMAHQFLNQLSEAIEDYSMALKLEPDHAETLIRRGQAFGQQENHAAAISDFSAALHRQNDSHLARHWRAQSLLTVGNLQKAKSDAVKAIKQAGDQPKYHTLHGDILQKEKEWARAVKAYNRAIRLDSNDPATYRKRGLSNMAGADYARAIHDFTHSLDLDPTQLEVLVQRGQAYLKEGQIRSAQEDFELALTHNSHLVKAYTGRASALVAQGLHEAALIWLTKAIHRFEAPRELSEILFSRGKVFYQMSRFEPAISDFSYVINLLRGGKRISVPARLARAAALVQNGDLKSAEKDLRRVLALQPNNLDARQANEWLKDGQGRRPLVLSPPESRIRPIRPPVVRKPLETSGDESQWNAPPPFDTWILRANDDREYGPLHKQHLNVWATEGRLDAGMKLLRADWSKWQRIEKVFPDLDPHAAAVEKFPGIQQRQPSA
jgi:tetratricopeptide (TPR) repeat protein